VGEKPSDSTGGQNNQGLPPVAAPAPTPSTPQTPEPSSGDGGNAPAPAPAPNAGPHSYRAVCEYTSVGGLSTLSSLAGPADFNESWYFAEPAPGQTTVTRADQNIIDIEGAVLAKPLDRDHLRMIFAARREDAMSRSGLKRMYFAEVDVIRHVGKVTEIGVAAQADAGAAALADRLGLTLRSHGVSDDGEFLFAPGAGATLQLVSVQTGRAVGAIALDPSRVFFPRLDGDVLSVLEYDVKAKAFKNAFYKLSAKPGAVFALKAQLVSAPVASGMTALGRAVAHEGERLWVEAETKALSNLVALEVVRLDLKTGQAVRTKLVVSGKSTFGTSFAFFMRDGSLNVVVAEESVAPIAQPKARGPVAKVHEAKLVVSELRSGGGVGQADEIPYPLKAVARIEKSGLGSKAHAVIALLSLPDLKDFMAVLPEEFGNHLFKFENGRLTRVTQFVCENPDLIVEPAR
jgi:hypothetical protein